MQTNFIFGPLSPSSKRILATNMSRIVQLTHTSIMYNNSKTTCADLMANCGNCIGIETRKIVMYDVSTSRIDIITNAGIDGHR